MHQAGQHDAPGWSRQQEFMLLLNPVYDNLYRFVRALVRSREEAFDLLHDTLLVAYEKFDTLKDKQAFTSWLFSIASRKHKRAVWRRRLFFHGDSTEAEHTLRAHDTSPDVQADVQMLYNALAKLPDKTREALVLFEISGFSLEEIQQLQGGSLSGVKSRLVRGREKLAKILGALSITGYSDMTGFHTNGTTGNDHNSQSAINQTQNKTQKNT